jgi:putative endonuclease
LSGRRQARGKEAEQRAVDYLCGCGYRIVERNFRCKLGELDIVALDGDTLVFVEVRSRQSARFGTALESVSPAKQRQVARVAQVYLTKHGPRLCRFDVIGITGADLTHVPDAFRLG